MNVSFSRTVTVPGGNVKYDVLNESKMGEVPLFVMVPGGPGSSSAYLTNSTERTPNRPILLYDPLGTGSSDRPKDRALWHIDRSVEELSLVIADVRNHFKNIKMEKIHLFGFSCGAMVAVDFYLKNKESVSLLILASPPISLDRHINYDMRKILENCSPEIREAIEKGIKTGDFDSTEYKSAEDKALEGRIYRRFHQLLTLSSQGKNLEIKEVMWGKSEFTVTGNLKDYDKLGELGKNCDIPILITCGKYGVVSPETCLVYQDSLQRRGVTVEMKVFSDSAHMPQLDEAESFYNFIQDYMNRMSGKEEPKPAIEITEID